MEKHSGRVKEPEIPVVEPCSGVEVACGDHSLEALVPALEVVVSLEDNLIVGVLRLAEAVAACPDQRIPLDDLYAQIQD